MKEQFMKRQKAQYQMKANFQESRRKEIESANLREIFQLYYKINKLTEMHDKQKYTLQEQLQAAIEEKDKVQKQSNKKDEQLIKLKRKLSELTEKNQQLSQKLDIYSQLENIFIEDKKHMIMKNYNKNQKAVQNGLLSNQTWLSLIHNTKIIPYNQYLNIPQQILNDNNIKYLYDLLLKNQWQRLEYLCFNAGLQPRQKSCIDDKLWKVLVQKTDKSDKKRFSSLKFLNLKNHKIKDISKNDFEEFPSLEKLDFRTNNYNQTEAYSKFLKVLNEYAKQKPNIKIQVTLQNGQWVQLWNGKIQQSKDAED